ncbi:MAG: hypothetical protein LC745_02835, partial [Planctomycetia bacterium]|nr:hypothetical protein [Planctomycetia bacterium]
MLIVDPRRPEPVAVVLAGASYADNLTVPHNALGWKGLQGIHSVLKTKQRWSWLARPSLQLLKGPKSLEFREDWDTLVGELAKAKIGPKTVLIVVALHGGSDPGGAYLLPNQAAGPGDRIPLKHVIESLARLPADKHKVLVLEGAQVAADWRLGMLSNEFARHLKGLEPAIAKVKNLWVLSGGDVDQRCWGSEGLGRTAFLHYLTEALRGEVVPKGRQPTLDEVYRYVRRNVADWAWNARGAVQEPVLLGPVGGDETRSGDPKLGPSRRVPLATIAGAPRPAQAEAFDPSGPAEAWKEFHKLDRSAPHPSVYSPRRWREYRARLVRFEELTRAGAADLSDSSKDRLRALETRLRGERFLKALPGSAENTLTMAAVRGGAIDPAPAVPAEFAALGRAATRSEAEKEWQKLRAADTDPGDDAPRPSLTVRVDDFLIRSAAEDTARVLANTALQLDVTRGTDFPPPAEAHFLRMLSASLDKQAARPVTSPFWGAAGQALAVRRAAEQAALGLPDQAPEFPYCEHVGPWIRSAVEAADQSRRLGEDRLFSSEGPAWAQAAESLNAARDAYGKARARARAVRAAFDARDRVFSDLPDASRWLAHRHSEDLEDDLPQAAEKLWAAAHDLSAALEEPGDAPEIEATARGLAEGFRALQERSRRFKAEPSGDRPGK